MERVGAQPRQPWRRFAGGMVGRSATAKDQKSREEHGWGRIHLPTRLNESRSVHKANSYPILSVIRESNVLSVTRRRRCSVDPARAAPRAIGHRRTSPAPHPAPAAPLLASVVAEAVPVAIVTVFCPAVGASQSAAGFSTGPAPAGAGAGSPATWKCAATSAAPSARAYAAISAPPPAASP